MVDAETRCQLWRNRRCDNTDFRTQGVNSGFVVAPFEPNMEEPRDLERFFGALEERFRSSALDNLNQIHGFVLEEKETAEHMFSHFNYIAKPLEDEQPRLMIREQLETTFMVQLQKLLSDDDFLLLNRDVRDSERERIRTRSSHSP